MPKTKINWEKARAYFAPIAIQIKEEVKRALSKNPELKARILHGETRYHPRYWLMTNPCDLRDTEKLKDVSAIIEKLSTEIAKKHGLQVSLDRGNITYYIRPDYQKFKR